MPVAAENALEIDLADLALHPARKSRQRIQRRIQGRSRPDREARIRRVDLAGAR